VGDLRIEEVRDEELRRYLRTALLWDENSVRPSQDRPCLFDVHIVGMSPQAFSLSGFERVDGAEYTQSWLVQSCQVRAAARLMGAGACDKLPRALNPTAGGRTLGRSRSWRR